MSRWPIVSPAVRAIVDADVVAVGVEFSVEVCAGLVEEGEDIRALGRAQVEEAGDVAPGNDQGVAGETG
jgi:hypothetical protein